MKLQLKIDIVYRITKQDGLPGVGCSIYNISQFPALNLANYYGRSYEEVALKAQDFIDNIEYDYSLNVRTEFII